MFVMPTNVSRETLLYEYFKLIFFFAECIIPTDCPAGGTNYICNANKCECPSPKVLDGNKCVGQLSFEKETLLTNELQFLNL